MQALIVITPSALATTTSTSVNAFALVQRAMFMVERENPHDAFLRMRFDTDTKCYSNGLAMSKLI